MGRLLCVLDSQFVDRPNGTIAVRNDEVASRFCRLRMYIRPQLPFTALTRERRMEIRRTRDASPQTDHATPPISSIFPGTSPSLLGRARVEAEAIAEANEKASNTEGLSTLALRELAERYYPAISHYIEVCLRKRPIAHRQGPELANQFVEKKLYTGVAIRTVDSSKGPYRYYLMRAMQNFLIDEYRRAVSGRETGPGADVSYQDMPQGWEPTEKELASAFDKGWIEGLITATYKRTRQYCLDHDQQVHFELFVRRVLPAKKKGWRELGAMFGKSASEAESLAQTATRHFRRIFRDVVSEETESMAEAEAIISTFLRTYGGRDRAPRRTSVDPDHANSTKDERRA